MASSIMVRFENKVAAVAEALSAKARVEEAEVEIIKSKALVFQAMHAANDLANSENGYIYVNDINGKQRKLTPLTAELEAIAALWAANAAEERATAIKQIAEETQLAIYDCI